MNAFKILGLSTDADLDSAKKAYRKLMQKWHPDKNKSPGAAEKFIEIRRAFEEIEFILSQPKGSRFFTPEAQPSRTKQEQYRPPPTYTEEAPVSIKMKLSNSFITTQLQLPNALCYIPPGSPHRTVQEVIGVDVRGLKHMYKVITFLYDDTNKFFFEVIDGRERLCTWATVTVLELLTGKTVLIPSPDGETSVPISLHEYVREQQKDAWNNHDEKLASASAFHLWDKFIIVKGAGLLNRRTNTRGELYVKLNVVFKPLRSETLTNLNETVNMIKAIRRY